MHIGLTGEYQPDKGLLFNKDAILLDPYARAVTGQEIWGEKMGEALPCPGGEGCV